MRKFILPLVILSLLGSTTNCAWLKSEGQVVKAAAIDCAKQDLGKTVGEAGMSILLTVVGVLYEGGANWRTDLAALETKYGPEVVACAAHISEQLFHSNTLSTADGASPEGRAHSFVQGGGWKF